MTPPALAVWAATSPRARTLAAAPQLVAAVRDVLGCLLAGAGEPEPRQAAAAVAGWGEGACRILGTARRAAAPFAALANGAAAHVLDFDDSFAPLTGHACATIVPALLATAEPRAASGADLLDALAVGLEVAARIGGAVNPRHYALGWHSTATIGAIASAAACARLLGLPPAATGDALGLAVSQAGGTRMQLGTAAKCLHAGLAAQAGVIAAAMAAQGMRGAEEALLGTWRFSDLYAGVDAPIAPPADDEPLAIVAPGMTYKPYPTCGSTHRSLDAILHLRALHGFTGPDVAAIETTIPAVNRRNLLYPAPETGMQARFSMQYCAALAAAQGSVRPVDFAPAALHRPPIRALMARIAMVDLPGSEDGAEDYLAQPAHTTIRLRDGRVLADTRYPRRGSPEAPMTEAEQVEKFRGCAAGVLNPAQADAAAGLIAGLADLPCVTALTGALCPPCQSEGTPA